MASRATGLHRSTPPGRRSPRRHEPAQGPPVVRDHAVLRDLVPNTWRNAYLDRNARRLEHVPRAPGIFDDPVILPRKKVDSADLRPVLLEELRRIARPVAVVGGEDEPAVPVDGVAHANLL